MLFAKAKPSLSYCGLMSAAITKPRTSAQAGLLKLHRGLLDDYLEVVESRTKEMQATVVPPTRAELNALIAETKNYIRHIDQVANDGHISNVPWRNSGWAREDEFAQQVLPESKTAALSRIAHLTKARLSIAAGE